MKQTAFKQANKSLALVGREPIPAYVDETVPQVVTCWHLTIWERIKLLFTGRVFTCTLSKYNHVQMTVLNINPKEIFPE